MERDKRGASAGETEWENDQGKLPHQPIFPVFKNEDLGLVFTYRTPFA